VTPAVPPGGQITVEVGAEHGLPDRERNGLMRWLLWTFHCRRGKKCADLVIDNIEPIPPPGTMFVVQYTCGGCGTRYRYDHITQRREEVH
jgi:hypothetical protein